MRAVADSTSLPTSLSTSRTTSRVRDSEVLRGRIRGLRSSGFRFCRCQSALLSCLDLLPIVDAVGSVSGGEFRAVDESLCVYLEVLRDDLRERVPMGLVRAEQWAQSRQRNAVRPLQPEEVTDGRPHAPVERALEELCLCEHGV